MSEVAEKKGLVPKLRFPEFEGTPGWKTARLGDLVDTVTPPKKLQTHEYKSAGAFPIIDQSQSSVAGWTNDKLAVVHTAVPLIVFGDHTCVLKRVAQPFAQGADGIKILRASEEIDPDFLYQNLGYKPLLMEDYRRHFGILCDRIVPMPNTSSADQRKIAEKEQRKIAECLQSLDDLIAAETGNLEALNRHKKGLLQQLFPAEGETTPRLRFPQFRNAGEWRTTTIKTVASIGSGTTPPRSNPAFFQGGTIPWVKTMDLNNSEIHQTDEMVTESSGVKVNPPGSVLVAMYGGFNQIGRTGVLTKPSATNQAIAVLNPKAREVSSGYLLMWLNANVELWKRVAASSRKDANITSSDVANFGISFPSLEEEQTVITTALEAVDRILSSLAARLTGLRTQKAALMQQLFPTLDEVEA